MVAPEPACDAVLVLDRRVALAIARAVAVLAVFVTLVYIAPPFVTSHPSTRFESPRLRFRKGLAGLAYAT
jgi:hypothetical protein